MVLALVWVALHSTPAGAAVRVDAMRRGQHASADYLGAPLWLALLGLLVGVTGFFAAALDIWMGIMPEGAIALAFLAFMSAAAASTPLLVLRVLRRASEIDVKRCDDAWREAHAVPGQA